ncbi:hypothetical protein A3C98_01765 [Candidatus Roizmanbacteria bacterium RIFCSPHIGHO2_02_FULL_37_15]|uniref:SUF system FeS cluster assembly SufBD core domain-containing protein n=1 Tax=Candidatus Roizmanbacteria bacterium RIFCSPLOWO2_01_FULL_37_16 TaxID=1802058 RepID=A0A1F7ILS0_9BACT|nr:MAG: hypothetical protein A2859_00215 [Candidatus Roizmanbacteria bacterium RIFCSPHIGHO2_01_FULL_37_16b]OGK20912.1 MAG: hypothetical protein A3C98_01765 [Candidatus Roizmanbacteria bacterium RIFCSPHIGHO2_02_FULL_37_15]OGK33791.1 MAG: hypothetical protein A3F57_00945 [Candidatus Roizmanbacteria bacterium RIFCSPHIGHO2_12_FULL_36_11]OGK44293.1 MAG: hypothetical protein A3B40_01485 [Candidatus Roizmanbacteria bacterium RIFCSPLOWO2_01_FULL_37_16]OGK57612.1 MAG: hypothetical protein A3I50_02725 [C
MKVNFINLNKTNQEKVIIVKPGKYIVFFQNLSGRFIFELKTKGIELDILGLYIGKAQNRFNLETIQRHIAPESKSNLLIKGVFYDESKFVYQGLIRIEKEAQKSKAYQKNQNLIISEKCFVDSRPFLEILANDVYCTHGSTTGKLNQEEIYYLQTRSLAKKAAEELLIEGFIQEIPAKIKQYGYKIH